MTLTELQSAAVTAIKTAIPTLAQCEIYGGQFAGEHGNRVAIHAPAVLIAGLGARPVTDPGIDGQMDVSARFAAYAVAKYANDRQKREGGCIDLAEAVALLIHNNNFTLPGVGTAKVMQVQGMTNAAADKVGFSIWSITWEQQIRIGAAPVSNYGPLTDVRIGFAPNIGLGHEPDYVAI